MDIQNNHVFMKYVCKITCIMFLVTKNLSLISISSFTNSLFSVNLLFDCFVALINTTHFSNDIKIVNGFTYLPCNGFVS